MNFINFGDSNNRWELDTIKEIVSLIKSYTVVHHLKNVKLRNVEDARRSDPENQRFNVDIIYTDKDGMLIEQRLLILKGEVIDGEEFHKRREEFYPRKAVQA